MTSPFGGAHRWAATWGPGGTSRAHTMTMSSFQGHKPLWEPLGATFRTWDAAETMRTNVDEGLAFVNGHVPHWGKTAQIRKRGALEHELTWAYYRMRRHEAHPQRKSVGETLRPTDVLEPMRGGNAFSFWRDLRPPFAVVDVKKASVDEEKHPDGDLYDVTYECGLDYRSERMWGEQSEGGTFNNRIHGVAQMRIPDAYPKVRPLTILSWGRPMLNWTPDDDNVADKPIVAPEKWSPIADQLGIRADAPRFAKVREATRKAKSRREVEVPELERLLLGPHASLPRLASVEAQRTAQDFATKSSPTPKKKMREHRIFTSAGGFIRYNG